MGTFKGPLIRIGKLRSQTKEEKLPPNKPLLFYIRLDKVVQVLEKKRVTWFDLASKARREIIAAYWD